MSVIRFCVFIKLLFGCVYAESFPWVKDTVLTIDSTGAYKTWDFKNVIDNQNAGNLVSSA